MDERSSHFFISVGRMCEDAAVGGLEVRVLTESGGPVEGVPDPPREAGERGLDDTGYEDGLRIGDRDLELHEIVEIAMHRPGAPSDQPAD